MITESHAHTFWETQLKYSIPLRATYAQMLLMYVSDRKIHLQNAPKFLFGQYEKRV